MTENKKKDFEYTFKNVYFLKEFTNEISKKYLAVKIHCFYLIITDKCSSF